MLSRWVGIVAGDLRAWCCVVLGDSEADGIGGEILLRGKKKIFRQSEISHSPTVKAPNHDRWVIGSNFLSSEENFYDSGEFLKKKRKCFFFFNNCRRKVMNLFFRFPEGCVPAAVAVGVGTLIGGSADGQHSVYHRANRFASQF